MDTGVSISSPARVGAGNIWTRQGQGWVDEDMPGWESFEMLFCVRVHSFQEDNPRGTRADRRPRPPERLCAEARPPPPRPTLARRQVENFNAIWVPSSRASSPPSSENFLLIRKQGSNKSDKLEQPEGVGPELGAAGFREEKARSAGRRGEDGRRAPRWLPVSW